MHSMQTRAANITCMLAALQLGTDKCKYMQLCMQLLANLKLSVAL